ncbi:MAG: phytoene desaturase family protein, partial [Flavobacteriales bacterium]
MVENPKHVVVIGSGFAGLAAAIETAHLGHKVTLLEKNSEPGGRARKFVANNFTFDMGPSWYWMPDVFDNFFESYGKKVSDFYELKRLDPSYRVVFKDGPFDVPASVEALKQEFESLEPGAAAKFQSFLDEAKIKYDIGMSKFVQKPGHSFLEFCELQIFKDALKLHIFKSFSSYVRKQFSHPKILQIIEFPVLFLGAKPQNTPALYSLMNYADSSLGTWYPMGGMNKIIQAFVQLAKEKNVQIILDASVKHISVKNGVAIGVQLKESQIEADCIIAAADYNHVDQNLIP